MTTSETKLRIGEVDNVTRVEFLERNILDEGNIQQIGAQLNAIIDSKDDLRLLIDFSNVDHLSSAALGTLITVRNRVAERGGQLRLSNIGAQIYEVFIITKLNKIFEIYPSDDEAIRSFS
jgi:anti-sigma B factor antagonist